MNKLKVKLENCYGIKKIEHVFDFANGCAQVIYAPNGAMKSSFARVFDDLSNGKVPLDRVFKNRIATVDIKLNDDDSELLSNNIFVIERYKDEIKSERVSTLLVNQQLKDEYDGILNAITDKRDHLNKNLETHSGLRNTIIKEVSETFKKKENDFLETLESLEQLVNNDDEPKFPSVVYREIFNDKVVTFLGTKDFKAKLDDYLDTYDELISKSTYFKKGIFTHNNADTISKSLKENGFFKASHTVSFNSGDQKKELNNQEELEQEIQAEKNKILTNEDLSKKFLAMDAAITKNVDLKNFRTYLEENPEIRPELRNIDKFREHLWISYLKIEKVLFNELLEIYKQGKIDINRITNEAKEQEAEWKAVVKIFNERFKVPYKLLVKNQDEVILNNAVPSIIFEYTDGDDTVEIGGAELIDILSTGEQRALYLLNILFEIEHRKKANDRNLIIIDDIADSFDYRNKYAIVEYLKDLIDCDKFRLIMLTHNFDFYRTVISRLSINKYTNSFLTIKTELELKLIRGKESLDVFGSLKDNYHNDATKLITAIPFVRNLIEYTLGTSEVDYKMLTALLHIKSQKGDEPNIVKATSDIRVMDLQEIFDRLFNVVVPIENPDVLLIDLIIQQGDAISAIPDETVNIENKIVLSMAIRLVAERYMISKINNQAFVDSITNYQTARLLKEYIRLFSGELDTIKILNRVNIMTPENIHLNSFMYEPILDLSDFHLRTLYNDIKALA